MALLLDTSVFSQPLRKNPEAVIVDRWWNSKNLVVSIISEAEILRGLYRIKSPRKIEYYRDEVRPRAEVVFVDHKIADTYAQMRSRQEEIGEPISEFDLLIAATAQVHDLTIATLNHRDFSRIEGIRWEDWSV